MNVIDHSWAKLFFSCGEEKNHSGRQSNREQIVHCWWEIFENEERQDNQANQIECIVIEDGKGRCFKIGHFILSREDSAMKKYMSTDSLSI